jgi:hypothetical protein
LDGLQQRSMNDYLSSCAQVCALSYLIQINLNGAIMSETAELELSIHRQDGLSYTVDFRYTDSDPDNQISLGTILREAYQSLSPLKLVLLVIYLEWKGCSLHTEIEGFFPGAHPH